MKLANKNYATEIHEAGQFKLSANDINKRDVSTFKRMNGVYTGSMPISVETDFNVDLLANLRMDIEAQQYAQAVVFFALNKAARQNKQVSEG